MEMCSGVGDTAELMVKRGYRGGPNFDMVCGIDLLKPQNKAYFLRYLEECKPRILLISTPCTGMKGFSALNRVVNHAGWVRSRRISVPLGNLGGIAAMAQMRGGRHFLAEHPTNVAMHRQRM